MYFISPISPSLSSPCTCAALASPTKSLSTAPSSIGSAHGNGLQKKYVLIQNCSQRNFSATARCEKNLKFKYYIKLSKFAQKFSSTKILILCQIAVILLIIAPTFIGLVCMFFVYFSGKTTLMVWLNGFCLSFIKIGISGLHASNLQLKKYLYFLKNIYCSLVHKNLLFTPNICFFFNV